MTMEAETILSRREATLRSVGTTCLGGIALLQAIALPASFAEGTRFGVLSMAAMALCIVLGWALAAAPANAAPQLWRGVAALGVLVLAGWAVPRAFTVPGLNEAPVHSFAPADTQGSWLSMPGAACAAMAAMCVVLATIAAPPTRAAARTLATAAVVVFALAPGVAVLLVSLGPGVTGGETVLATGGHIHSQGSPESAIQFQSIDGGNGGHFVYRAVDAPQQTAFGLALVIGAALLFIVGNGLRTMAANNKEKVSV